MEIEDEAACKECGEPRGHYDGMSWMNKDPGCRFGRETRKRNKVTHAWIHWDITLTNCVGERMLTRAESNNLNPPHLEFSDEREADDVHHQEYSKGSHVRKASVIDKRRKRTRSKWSLHEGARLAGRL